MKKSLFILVGILLYSCSSDNSDNSTPDNRPSAPTELNAVVVSGTEIDLSWTDNSNN